MSLFSNHTRRPRTSHPAPRILHLLHRSWPLLHSAWPAVPPLPLPLHPTNLNGELSTLHAVQAGRRARPRPACEPKQRHHARCRWNRKLLLTTTPLSSPTAYTYITASAKQRIRNYRTGRSSNSIGLHLRFAYSKFARRQNATWTKRICGRSDRMQRNVSGEFFLLFISSAFYWKETRSIRFLWFSLLNTCKRYMHIQNCYDACSPPRIGVRGGGSESGMYDHLYAPDVKVLAPPGVGALLNISKREEEPLRRGYSAPYCEEAGERKEAGDLEI